ncbi:SdhB [Laribacter hongkongensis HLHK9]|uniref:Succinate dehydrogenase iron-sulfur subunit n=2 Tax=Laribacter hongkongensis TaxID=168471 RepID=C1DB61_LARHH|nr:SdhB [Laribacter hongkongensis HLHK9]
MEKMRFSLYRYNPEKDDKPYMQDIEVEVDSTDVKLLDALVKLKAVDDSLSFRRSCREGICGSDAMNINGRNGLACITDLRSLKQPITLRPLPGLPVIRDLIVDMTQFFKQYHSIKPYLINDTPAPDRERYQSPEDREKLDGLYECILCACCSTSCPSFWWNPDKYVGPAGLLAAYRFIIDSRDEATSERLDNLNDPYRLFRCHTIMNCTDVCPKGPESGQGDRQHQGHDGHPGDLMMDSRYDRAARQRIRWHSRRGLLEMDLVLTRFLDRHFDTLGDEEMDAYVRLLELIDTEFLEIVNGKRDVDDPALQPLVDMLRAV